MYINAKKTMSNQRGGRTPRKSKSPSQLEEALGEKEVPDSGMTQILGEEGMPEGQGDNVAPAGDQVTAQDEGDASSQPSAKRPKLSQSFPGLTGQGKPGELPIFVNEEDKVAFEESLNVDFESQIEHLYKVHIIDQDVNELAPPPASRSTNHLSVFSCNECDKVFMSLSQVKTHVLIHTGLKPFKCIQCDYATNSKG